MPLNEQQKIRMAVGGTTGLPAPFPTIGTISLEEPTGAATGESLVRITFSQSANKAVIWSVRAADISAIEQRETLQKQDADGNPIVSDWHVGTAEVLAALSDEDKPISGFAYVREDKQVLLTLEFGLTANDSVGVALRRAIPADGDIDVSCKRPSCCE